MSIKISKKTKPIKVEEVEAEPVVDEVEETEEEISIQKPVRKLKEPTQESVPEPVKEKKPRSEKQQQAFLKALSIKKENEARRKAERAAQEAEAKEALQQIIVAKAIKIKQKQIKKVKVLEEISDEESEEEEEQIPIKPVKKSTAPKPVAKPQPVKQAPAPPAQKYRFL